MWLMSIRPIAAVENLPRKLMITTGTLTMLNFGARQKVISEPRSREWDALVRRPADIVWTIGKHDM